MTLKIQFACFRNSSTPKNKNKETGIPTYQTIHFIFNEEVGNKRSKSTLPVTLKRLCQFFKPKSAPLTPADESIVTILSYSGKIKAKPAIRSAPRESPRFKRYEEGVP